MTGLAVALDRRRPRWPDVLAAHLRRDLAIALSYRLPFVLGLLQSVFALGFIFFVGRLVGPRIALAGTRGTYFDFAVLGTVLLTLFNTSLVAMSQQLRSLQTTGTLEVLFTMPLRPGLTALSSVAYQVCYAALSGVLTLVIAVGMGLRFHVGATGAVVALAAAACSLAMFLAVGIAFAGYVLVFKRGETVTGIAVAALTLLGGVYYPVRLLPHALRLVADALPFTWALEVLRSSLLDGGVPVARLGAVAVATALSMALALWVFGAAVGHARRRGTLGQY